MFNFIRGLVKPSPFKPHRELVKLIENREVYIKEKYVKEFLEYLKEEVNIEFECVHYNEEHPILVTTSRGVHKIPEGAIFSLKG